MNKLVKEFFESNKGDEFWPPLNNVSAFLWQWNERQSFSCFKDKTKVDCLIFSDLKASFGFFSSNKLVEISKEFFTDFYKDSRVIDNKKKDFKNIEKLIDSDYLKFNDDFIKNQNNSFLQKEIVKTLRRCWLSNGIVWFSVHNLEPEFFFQEVNLGIEKEAVLNIWSRAILPTSLSFDRQHLVFLLSLIISGRNINQITVLCQYFYATYDHVLSLKEVRTRLQDEFGEYLNNRSKASLKLSSLREEHQSIISKYRAWRKTLSLKQKKIVDYIQAVIEFRDLRKNTFNKSFVISWRMAKEFLKRADIEERYIAFILPEEYEQGIGFLKGLKQDIIKRTKGFGLYVHYNGKKEIFYQAVKKSRLEIDKFYTKTLVKNVDKNIINGQVGSSGITSGIVRKVLCLDGDIINKFKKGEVLVSGMTRPEFTPLMKKASAIVTDEGGITCHASIVSRELKKPCVIGTKVATKFLKDGDLVEVDANRGIVRILKRA